MPLTRILVLGYYGQPQPQYVAQGIPPKSTSGGIGMGTAVAAGT